MSIDQKGRIVCRNRVSGITNIRIRVLRSVPRICQAYPSDIFFLTKKIANLISHETTFLLCAIAWGFFFRFALADKENYHNMLRAISMATNTFLQQLLWAFHLHSLSLEISSSKFAVRSTKSEKIPLSTRFRFLCSCSSLVHFGTTIFYFYCFHHFTVIINNDHYKDYYFKQL